MCSVRVFMLSSEHPLPLIVMSPCAAGIAAAKKVAKYQAQYTL
jgi:hypothetical protein